MITGNPGVHVMNTGRLLLVVFTLFTLTGASGCREGSLGRRGAVVDDTMPSPAYAMMPQQGFGQPMVQPGMQIPIIMNQPAYTPTIVGDGGYTGTLCAPCTPVRQSGSRTSSVSSSSTYRGPSAQQPYVNPPIAPAPQPGPQG